MIELKGLERAGFKRLRQNIRDELNANKMTLRSQQYNKTYAVLGSKHT